MTACHPLKAANLGVRPSLVGFKGLGFRVGALSTCGATTGLEDSGSGFGSVEFGDPKPQTPNRGIGSLRVVASTPPETPF